MCYLITVFLLVLPVFTFAQAPAIPFAPKNYVCYRTPEPLDIDGKLDEKIWAAAAFTDTFVDIQGDALPVPAHDTRVKMLWDDAYLYVGAVLDEPHVWATITENETVIFRDNDFEIFIDPDGDTHHYYEFEINALGTTWDLMLGKPYRDGGPSLTGYDLHGLKSAVSIQGTINHPAQTDTSWTVEIALPLKALAECNNPRRPPVPGDQWRINFSRVQWQTEVVAGKYQKKINPATGKSFPEDNWVWSPQGLINMHVPEMWGFLQFSEKDVQQGNAYFHYQSEDYTKWALRQIYYRQKAYRQKHGQYADNLDKLNASTLEVSGIIFSPALEAIASMYEAYCTDKETGHRWHINQEGKVWQSP